MVVLGHYDTCSRAMLIIPICPYTWQTEEIFECAVWISKCPTKVKHKPMLESDLVRFYIRRKSCLALNTLKRKHIQVCTTNTTSFLWQTHNMIMLAADVRRFLETTRPSDSTEMILLSRWRKAFAKILNTTFFLMLVSYSRRRTLMWFLFSEKLCYEYGCELDAQTSVDGYLLWYIRKTFGLRGMLLVQIGQIINVM